MKEFFKQILDGRNPTSAKRFITLLMAAHLIVTSFLVSFFTFYLILYVPKGSVNMTLISLLQNILDADLYIILAGLGIIGAENIGNILLEKAKAKANATIQTGIPQADNINVDTVNVTQEKLPKV